MLKIVKIGDIILDNPLWLIETYKPKNVEAKTFNTIGGSKVVFESYKRNNANYITLDSKQTGWIKDTTLQDIVNLTLNIGEDLELTTADNNKIKVRFALEKENVITYSPIWEGSNYYTIKIIFAYA